MAKSLKLCWREFSKTEVASEAGGAFEMRGFKGAELQSRSITGLEICQIIKKTHKMQIFKGMFKLNVKHSCTLTCEEIH